ncbi:uncharacterized protein LOC122063598 [Macadamia integrifolia]|uniref:uncharacterized protein LOC122063598 n=1 Tax=Macadamia integrifolia TaxID=60698 RepID=UPI001C4E8D4F|nr:uncharacterized protein LOC122063598 [Macadamia integrifolia]
MHDEYFSDIKAFWAIKQLNFDLSNAGTYRGLQLAELEEIRNDAYDNARIYKAKINCKLRSHWDGPYIVQTIFSHGAVEVLNPSISVIFKVNGQSLKPFFELPTATSEEVMDLDEPLYTND